jgi:hypothetical protein
MRSSRLRSFLLFLLTIPVAVPAAGESIQLSACLLLKGESFGRQKLPPFDFFPKKPRFPESVKPFLKATGLLDTANGSVRKAAQAVAKAAAGSDPLPALRSWMDAHFQDAQTPAQFSGDFRKCWPRASELIRSGKTDVWGRTRVSVAVLRAMGVPARPCWYEGKPYAQAWFFFGASHDGARGAWVTETALARGESVDGWALESSEVPPFTAKTGQKLGWQLLPYQRAFYALTETAEADEDFAYLTDHGELSPRSLQRTAPILPAEGTESIRTLVLVRQGVKLEAQGKLKPIAELELLTPYVPHLRSWGKEHPPTGGRLGVIKQALWTDQPSRIRRGTKGLTDDWQSPPPAFGVIHYLSIGIQ